MTAGAAVALAGATLGIAGAAAGLIMDGPVSAAATDGARVAAAGLPFKLDGEVAVAPSSGRASSLPCSTFDTKGAAALDSGAAGAGAGEAGVDAWVAVGITSDSKCL